MAGIRVLHKTRVSQALPCLTIVTKLPCLTREARDEHAGTLVVQAHPTTAWPLAGLPSAPWGQSLISEIAFDGADVHAGASAVEILVMSA